jgi:DNA mismatch repair protein MutS2
MALNNAEIELEAREAEEESAVLFALSGMVAQHAKPLQGLLRSITALDVASARGRHAAWLGATTPPRFLTAAQAAAGGPVQLPRAWHPLLLQPCLPPLPLPLLPEELQQQVEAQPLTGSLSGLALVPELAAAATPKPSGAVGSSMPRRGAKGASAAKAGDATAPAEGSTVRPAPPQPVDLQVPAGVRVVAVTGPNTGGKTASLKALGLSCLMAKAGLFLPQAPLADGAQHAQQQGQQQGLLWFDRVLADLGDGQSLQQSLSTFSGHLRRIRNVLAAATPQVGRSCRLGGAGGAVQLGLLLPALPSPSWACPPQLAQLLLPSAHAPAFHPSCHCVVRVPPSPAGPLTHPSLTPRTPLTPHACTAVPGAAG